jgi:superfamily II DNA or RNA helicase
MSDNINLNKNGRLFPLWVLSNFKKYQLPEIIRKKDVDPCNFTIKKELNKYQEFIGKYLDYRSPFKDILIYHGLGSGKTVSAINIYNVLYNYTPDWNVFIIIPASLRNDPWLKDLNNWLTSKNFKDKMENIVFVHYDSPYADRDFLEKIKKVDSSKKTMFIFDEVQKFIRNVYNNISTKKGKRAQVIYDYIQQEKKENYENRIILLSATPAVNNPYEFALIFNLLRPGTFPESEAVFNQIFISSTNFASLNLDTKNMFQRRIMGLVSYYIGATPDKYATKTIHYKDLKMNTYYEEVYNYFEEIEKEKEKISRRMNRGKVGDNMSTYASYTRQACNFVFPPINSKITGEKRPRPGQFRLKNKDGIVLDEGKDLDKKKQILNEKEIYKDYIKANNEFIKELINYFKIFLRKDKQKNHTLKDDVKLFFDKYNGSLNNFIKNQNKKSELFKILYKCSPKMMHIIFNILKSPGSVMVYSNYVAMEGLQIFKIYLSFFGFISFNNDEELKEIKNKKLSKDHYRYIEFHGGVDKKLRENNKKIFNTKENMKGNLIKLIMISPSGAEGINLSNVRQVHIMEPFWNEVRIEQVIGRAIRQCQHKDLPLKDRTVDVFRYKMVRKNEKETSDEMMERLSRKKHNLLLSFIEAIREVSVDCELFKNHNMMGSKYNCFKFNQESYFEENIGPAYEKSLEFDNKMNNGLNSNDSKVVDIKVKKINYVTEINDKIYSDPLTGWYDEKTSIVYDYDLEYPIGKIEKDENNNELKLDNYTYIMKNKIKIPLFKIFD